MIIVDTSIWVDHLRALSPFLVRLLDDEQVLTHPFVIGELAMGDIRDRRRFLSRLELLPLAPVAAHHEVLALVEANHLYGKGIGYADAHLVASARLKAGTQLLTRDRRLAEVADRLGIAARPNDG